LLAAAFFPVATLATVFGMNLAHGMEEWATPAHFWGILGLGLASGLLLARIIARKPAPIARPHLKGPAQRR
jgi:Mg2+ and Co2+ transporter CorA